MKRNKITRREFTKSMLAAGAVVGLGGMPGCSSQNPAQDTLKMVGLQLYTMRKLAQEDFVGTLKKVAKMGYDAVEFAGYGGLSAAEIKALVQDLGLIAVGSHEGFEGLAQALDERIEFNLEVGNQYMVVPGMPQQFRESGVAGIKEFAQNLTAFGEKIKQAGMQLCYHNHAFEFEQIEGEELYEVLFAEADADLVQAEVDVYWVQYGGVDPVAHLKKYAGRCPLLHMKDMKLSDEKKTFAPVGTGVLDMPAIIKTARETGGKWFIVEQDASELPIEEAVKISLNNMKKLVNS